MSGDGQGMDPPIFEGAIPVRVKHNDLDERQAQSRWANVLELLDWLKRKADEDDMTLLELVQHVALVTMLERADDEEPDAVKLSTLHASKGLEYPHVYLIGVEEGLLPHRGGDEEGDVSEAAVAARARRIEELLGERCGLDDADFVATHNDTWLATVPLLTSLLPGLFDDFDERMDAGSPAAGRFAAWRSALVRRLVAAPALAPLLDPPPEHQHDPVFGPWLDPTHRVALALPTLVAAGSPFELDLAAVAREAWADVAAAYRHTVTRGEDA